MSTDTRTVWGPAILPGDQYFIFMGRRYAMPPKVEDHSKFIKQLEYVERFNWAYSSPEERREIFHNKLWKKTLNLQMNWATQALAVYSVVSTVFLVIIATAKIKTRL